MEDFTRLMKQRRDNIYHNNDVKCNYPLNMSVCDRMDVCVFVNFQREKLLHKSEDKRVKLSCCMRITADHLKEEVCDKRSILYEQNVHSTHVSYSLVHATTLNETLLRDIFLSLPMCEEHMYAIKAGCLAVPHLLSNMSIDTISVDFTNLFNERGDWAYQRYDCKIENICACATLNSAIAWDSIFNATEFHHEMYSLGKCFEFYTIHGNFTFRPDKNTICFKG